MIHIPDYSSRKIIKALKSDGWYYVYSRGGHDYFKHPQKSGKITVPSHNKELKPGTYNSILKQAGLK